MSWRWSRPLYSGQWSARPTWWSVNHRPARPAWCWLTVDCCYQETVNCNTKLLTASHCHQIYQIREDSDSPPPPSFSCPLFLFSVPGSQWSPVGQKLAALLSHCGLLGHIGSLLSKTPSHYQTFQPSMIYHDIPGYTMIYHDIPCLVIIFTYQILF